MSRWQVFFLLTFVFFLGMTFGCMFQVKATPVWVMAFMLFALLSSFGGEETKP